MEKYCSLNIGSRDERIKDCINLDIKRFKGVNVLGSGTDLPFKDNSIDRIFCIHVLEHVTRDKNIFFLKEMYRVLKSEGVAYIEVPDFQAIIALLHIAFDCKDEVHIHQWTTSIYGKNEHNGMAHYWGFSLDKLIEKTKEVGFKYYDWILNDSEMVSSHYKQEPVILLRVIK